MGLFSCLAILAISLSALVLAADLPATATLYHWPLLAPAPTPIAALSYNPSTLKSDVVSFTPPSAPETEELTRIGLYDPNTKAWKGVVTSTESFDPKYKAIVTLYLAQDDSAQIVHVDFAAGIKVSPDLKGKKARAKALAKAAEEGDLQANVARVSEGPRPTLNKPVVLNPEGKLPEQEAEKTFLQKYWWILLGVTVLLMSGGGEK